VISVNVMSLIVVYARGDTPLAEGLRLRVIERRTLREAARTVGLSKSSLALHARRFVAAVRSGVKETGKKQPAGREAP